MNRVKYFNSSSPLLKDCPMMSESSYCTSRDAFIILCERNFVTKDELPSLHAFARQRANLLAILKPLPPEGWSRVAAVTGAGKVLERTVLFYAQWLARHERPHVKQVARIANTLLR
jgi:hypothetical protein